MAEQVVNRRVNIYIDETAGTVALERLTKKENELVAAIEKGKKSGKDLTREMNLLAETKTKIGQLKDVMDGKVLPSIRQAEAAVSKLRRELKGIPANSQAAADKLQQLKKAESTLIAVKNAANGVSNAMGGIASGNGFKQLLNFAGGAFLGGGALGIVQGLASGLKSFFEGAVDEALQAEEATARFKAQLDNLGQANVFQSLTEEANKLATAFSFLDNDEIIGVFEQLINYGKLTETQIKELTPVIIDFAAKQRIDLSTAADVVVKALEGNGKALKTYGIDIKDAKDVTEAFGIVMTQLKPKVEGAAKTFGEETAGQIAATRQEIKNLQEDIGVTLLPFLKGFYNSVKQMASGLRDLFATGKIIGGETQFGADLRARQEFLTSMAEDFAKQNKDRQVQLINSQRFLIKTLAEDVKAANGKRKLELKTQFDEEVKLFNKFVELYKKAPDNIVIGTGGGPNSGGTKAGKVPKAKDTIGDLEKKYLEFANRTEEATAPILAAFRKINEAAAEDIKTVNEALKANIITPEDAERALQLIERVLNQQRDAIAKKFNINPEPLGTLSPDIPIEERFGKDAEMGAKDLGAKIAKAILEAIAGGLPKTPSDSPIADWIDKEAANIQMAFANLQEISNIFLSIGDMRANADEAALQKEIANNDRRRESAKKLFDNKLISEKEYNRRLGQIANEQEKKEKEFRKRQFERDKNAQTVQALMSGAQAIVSTLAARPGLADAATFAVLRGIQVGLVAAATAAQVATIRSQKPPQFAEGGFIPQGSSHKQGGIALIDNRTGARVGEVEGGEPILSKKTYARNKPLIDSLLSQSTSTMSMNIPNLNKAMRTVLEGGGFIPRSGEANNSELQESLTTLNTILMKGIRANVIYGEYEEKSDMINSIRSQSMIS
jgi:hypothetical protein